MPVDPLRLVLLTLLPGQVITGACSFCQAPLAFEPADSVTRIERCRAPKCERAVRAMYPTVSAEQYRRDREKA